MVNPSLTNHGPEDLYAIYLKEFHSNMVKDTVVSAPTLARDISPWLRVARFHVYLGDYVTDTAKREELFTTMKTPKSRDPLYGRLHNWVLEYMEQIRETADNKVPHTFLKHLKHHGEE
jgi:hypothetical protein